MCNVEIKIKQLKSVYKKYKDSQATSGAGRKKTTKVFLTTWTIFLNDQPDATGVANAIDASDDTVNETEDESDVSVDLYSFWHGPQTLRPDKCAHRFNPRKRVNDYQRYSMLTVLPLRSMSCTLGN